MLQRWMPGQVSGTQGGRQREEENHTNRRQPPGQPYAAGWPQLKVSLAHLWGFPLRRNLLFSHQ